MTVRERVKFIWSFFVNFARHPVDGFLWLPERQVFWSILMCLAEVLLPYSLLLSVLRGTDFSPC